MILVLLDFVEPGQITKKKKKKRMVLTQTLNLNLAKDYSNEISRIFEFEPPKKIIIFHGGKLLFLMPYSVLVLVHMMSL